MSILMAPMGKLIQGHVLDVDVKRFNEALRAYDPLLYTKWNPKKLRGHGCWEIRRRPEFHTALDVSEFQDGIILKIGPHEVDFVHHVLDCAFLNYDQLRKLKEMDTFQYGGNDAEEAARHWELEKERRTLAARDAAKEHGMKMRRAASKEFKAQIRAFKEYIRSGGNPHQIAEYWERVNALE